MCNLWRPLTNPHRIRNTLSYQSPSLLLVREPPTCYLIEWLIQTIGKNLHTYSDWDWDDLPRLMGQKLHCKAARNRFLLVAAG